LKINYKMLSLSLVIVAILAALLTSTVLAAPNGQNFKGNGKGIAYGPQNGCGQQLCQGQCDGECDGQCGGECDGNKGECTGDCTGNGTDGFQGSANRGNSQGCHGQGRGLTNYKLNLRYQ